MPLQALNAFRLPPFVTSSLDPSNRFRGYLPVVVDLETAGLNPSVHALLQLGLVILDWSPEFGWFPSERYQWDIEPHPKTQIDDRALEVTGINPKDPNRQAMSEAEALQNASQLIRAQLAKHHCNKALMVAHNATFDLSFWNAAAQRSNLVNGPFHLFCTLDTSALASLTLGHNVLFKACGRAQMPFNSSKAHNALYDANKTAELFCSMVNTWELYQQSYLAANTSPKGD